MAIIVTTNTRLKQFYEQKQNVHNPTTTYNLAYGFIPSKSNHHGQEYNRRETKIICIIAEDNIVIATIITITETQLQTIEVTIIIKEQDIAFVSLEDDIVEIKVIIKDCVLDQR